MYSVVDMQGKVLVSLHNFLEARAIACKESVKRKVIIEKSGVKMAAYLDSKAVALKDLN
jgi:hypothetical protein